jgi:uncharacterized surface protein with fasciclin (FAS1) repeats
MLQAKIITFPGHMLAPRRDPIDRTFHGLLATGLLEDVRAGGRYTLIAPTNSAFDALPWAFEDLVADPDLTEVRFDLFEYLLVEGDLVSGEAETLEGREIRIERGQVIGGHGAANILRSFVSGNLRIHVVDACVLPASPQIYVDAAGEVCDERLC